MVASLGYLGGLRSHLLADVNLNARPRLRLRPFRKPRGGCGVYVLLATVRAYTCWNSLEHDSGAVLLRGRA